MCTSGCITRTVNGERMRWLLLLLLSLSFTRLPRPQPCAKLSHLSLSPLPRPLSLSRLAVSCRVNGFITHASRRVASRRRRLACHLVIRFNRKIINAIVSLLNAADLGLLRGWDKKWRKERERSSRITTFLSWASYSFVGCERPRYYLRADIRCKGRQAGNNAALCVVRERMDSIASVNGKWACSQVISNGQRLSNTHSLSLEASKG